MSDRSGSIRRNRSLRLLVGSTAVSSVGGAAALVILPLLAMSNLDATETQVGLLRSAQLIPFLVLSLPLGLLVDRRSRHSMMAIAELARAGAFAAIGSLAVAGVLSYPVLIALVVVVGCFSVLYELSYLSAMPEIVETRQLQTSNRAVEVAQSGASGPIPFLAGVLAGAVGAGLAVLASAVSYLLSLILLLFNRWTEQARARSDERIGARLLAGFRFISRDPHVAPMLAHLGFRNIFLQAFQTALLILLVQRMGLSDALVGLVVAGIGVGFLVGAASSPRLSGHLGIGRVTMLSAVTGGAGMILVATPGTGVVLPAVGALVAGVGAGMYNLQSIAVRQAVTPPDVLGRVNAVVKIVSYAAMSLGAFLGGYLSGIAEPVAVVVCAGVGSVLAGGFLVSSPVRRLRDLPEPAHR